MPICQQCGYILQDSLDLCPECHSNPKEYNASHIPLADGTALFWVTLFLGWLGIHQFMVGRKGRGIAYFLGSTIGAIFVFPALIVAVLVMRDLIRISQGKFKGRIGAKSYAGKHWMSKVLVLLFLILPLLFMAGIFAALWWAKSSLEKADQIQSVESVVEGYVELSEVYLRENKAIGSWDAVHFDPGLLNLGGFQVHLYSVEYSELDPGIRILNTHDMKGCPGGNVWELVPSAAQNLETGTSLLQLSLKVPNTPACKNLFPNLYRLNGGKVLIQE